MSRGPREFLQKPTLKVSLRFPRLALWVPNAYLKEHFPDSRRSRMGMPVERVGWRPGSGDLVEAGVTQGSALRLFRGSVVKLAGRVAGDGRARVPVG
jgi:hypothetical protein